MQVSWIDPEEVRALLANIEGPRKVAAASNIAWEVHTLPVVPLPPPQENIIDPPVEKPAPPPLPPEMPLSDGGIGPRGGELWRIRENLRSLREQAQFSGLIPQRVDQPTAPPQPEPVEELAPEDIAVQLAEAIEQRDAPPPPAPEATPRFQFQPMPFEPEPVTDEIVATPPRAPTGPMIEPTPAPTHIPEELPQPKPATSSLQPPTIEYSGPAPSGPDYEPLFGNGLATEPEPSPAPPSPAEALETLLDAEPPNASSSKPAFVPPAVGLSDRLNALALWSCDRLGSQEVLLVDDYGDVLWGSHAQTPLVISAMMAWHAGQRSTAGIACTEPERIDRPMANGRALTVIPARTRYGTVSLAAIQDQPVGTDDEQAIRAALIAAVEGPVD